MINRYKEIPITVFCPRDLTNYTVYIRTIIGNSREDSLAISNGCDSLNGCDTCNRCLAKYSDTKYIPDFFLSRHTLI